MVKFLPRVGRRLCVLIFFRVVKASVLKFINVLEKWFGGEWGVEILYWNI